MIKVGQSSKTWWGQHFLNALEGFTDSSRLSRGRSYSSDNRIKKWENLGLKGLSDFNGEKKWVDFCLFESMLGGSNLSCDWLSYDLNSKCVFIKDKPFGEIAFRNK